MLADRLAYSIRSGCRHQKIHRKKKKKEAAKYKIQQLAKKQKKEAKPKAQVEVEHAAKQRAEQEECDSEQNGKSPLP